MILQLAYDSPLLINCVEKFMSVLCYKYKVLNTNTVFSFNVNTWFDREDHSRLSNIFVDRAYITVLVVFLSDKVWSLLLLSQLLCELRLHGQIPRLSSSVGISPEAEWGNVPAMFYRYQVLSLYRDLNKSAYNLSPGFTMMPVKKRMLNGSDTRNKNNRL